MEIGYKLKQARTDAKLTQEAVAEHIGVSRQTISNWENNKSYPDIISVIKLSDLYSVSLDELLKGDQNMLNHLEESTDTVKSQKQFSYSIRIAIFAECFILSLILFCLVLWLVPGRHPLLDLLIRILPALFAQLLLSSITPLKAVRAVPFVLTSLFALWGIYLYNTSPAWIYATLSDLLIDYVSPAAACGITFILSLLKQ